MNPFSSPQIPSPLGRSAPEPASPRASSRQQRLLHERLLAEERAERAETGLEYWAQLCTGGQWVWHSDENLLRLEGLGALSLPQLMSGLAWGERVRLLRRVLRCRQRGGFFTGLACWQAAGAVPRWLELRGRLRGDGVWWGVYRDASAEQERIRELEAALRAREELLAGVSHEIRTPLGGMRGLVDLVMDGRLSTDQREYLQALRGSADMLLCIVNDVLDLARLEAGGMQLEQVAFSLPELLDTTLRTLAPEAERKGLECFYTLAPDVPLSVRGDPLRMRQVISNLLSNAIRFTDSGQVEVFVRRVAGAEGARLLVSVRDSGCGVPPALRQRIFDPFVQALPSHARTHGGSGLGLALCRRMVALMGGRIRLGSRPGRGSVFMFDVPLTFAGEPIQVGAAPRLEGRRVLLAAPNARWRRSLRGLLGSWGLEVVEVADGDEALQALAQASRQGEAFDFLLLDARMAPPGGLGLVERLSAGWPTLERVILMCDPALKQVQAPRLAGLHVGGHLLKPFSAQTLENTLMQALQGAPVLSVPPVEGAALQALAALPPQDVLLVDDSPLIQLALGAVLRQAGHRVTQVGSGTEALEVIDARRHFDLVLLDIQLPGMDGFETLRAIRALEARRSWVIGGEWRPLSVVAMTAHALPADRERCLAAGMDAYLSKPVHPELLLDVMRTLAAGGGGAMHPAEEGAHAWADLGGSPVVADLDETLALLGGNRQALHEMAQMFLEGVERQQGQLREAWKNRAWARLRERVHALKGSVSVFHATGFLQAAQAVEQAARAGEGAAVDELMPRLLRELQLLVGVLRKSCLGR